MHTAEVNDRSHNNVGLLYYPMSQHGLVFKNHVFFRECPDFLILSISGHGNIIFYVN